MIFYGTLHCKFAKPTVSIYPEIYDLLRGGQWADAYAFARNNRNALSADGYHADGVKVIAGESWYAPVYDQK